MASSLPAFIPLFIFVGLYCTSNNISLIFILFFIFYISSSVDSLSCFCLAAFLSLFWWMCLRHCLLILLTLSPYLADSVWKAHHRQIWFVEQNWSIVLPPGSGHQVLFPLCVWWGAHCVCQQCWVTDQRYLNSPFCSAQSAALHRLLLTWAGTFRKPQVQSWSFEVTTEARTGLKLRPDQCCNRLTSWALIFPCGLHFGLDVHWCLFQPEQFHNSVILEANSCNHIFYTHIATCQLLLSPGLL